MRSHRFVVISAITLVDSRNWRCSWHFCSSGRCADKWGTVTVPFSDAQVLLFALAQEMSDSPTDPVNHSAASVTRQLQLVFQLLGFLLGLLIVEELVYRRQMVSVF
jgi:hypothetical protein